MPTTVIITPAGRDNPTRTANRFTAALSDGTPLATRPTVPVERAACRALVALGYPDGPVEFRHAGAAGVSLRFRSVHAAARYTVTDDEQHGPRVVRYSADERYTAASVAGYPPTGNDETPVQRRTATRETHVWRATSASLSAGGVA